MMGNNTSAMLRKTSSKIFREQGDSPETTISDAAPSPPRLLPRQVTMSPFRFSTPSPTRARVRRIEEASPSPSPGDGPPLQHSKLHKLPREGRTRIVAAKQFDKPSTGFPVVSVTASSPEARVATQGHAQTVNPTLSNTTLSPPSSSHTGTLQRPSSAVRVPRPYFASCIAFVP